MAKPQPNRIAFDSSAAGIRPFRRLRDAHDPYFSLLGIVLMGYAFMGKGFAYVGYPPLLIGEVTMLLGLAVIYRSRCGAAMLASLPSLFLAALLVLVTAKVFGDVRVYGIDAIRDGVIVFYGLYAFIVIALLLERPERLERVVESYSSLAWLYGFLGGVVFYVTSFGQAALPVWPLSGVTVVYVRLGEAAVHLSGAAVFVLLGLRKVHPLWTLVMVVSIVLISPSRGAMLACVVPIVMAAILGGKVSRFGPALLIGAILFMLAYAAGVEIPLPGGRSIGPEQIINNLDSITGSSEAANLDGTKEWRLRWWQAIIDYTVNGPYFWSGKGFGMGLAEADGFVVGTELGGPIVRSPHNAQLTMLSRAGVPGLALWLAMLCAWFVMVFGNMVTARRRAETRWANIFIWIACYLTSILIDASFDVALEGPMLGIWFWSLFGFGIGASMIYRYDVLISRQTAISVHARTF